jgi:hypothetical protein
MYMDNRHLIASEGMALTNGATYAVEVWLGDWDSPDNWQEITQEEAEARQEEAGFM